MIRDAPGLAVIFGIPTVGTNHEFSGDMPRGHPQQYFVVAAQRSAVRFAVWLFLLVEFSRSAR